MAKYALSAQVFGIYSNTRSIELFCFVVFVISLRNRKVFAFVTVRVGRFGPWQLYCRPNRRPKCARNLFERQQSIARRSVFILR